MARAWHVPHLARALDSCGKPWPTSMTFVTRSSPENPGTGKVGSAWLWVKIGCIPDIAGAIRSSAKKMKSKL